MNERSDPIGVGSEIKSGDNPYVGPRTFREDEADHFFGRDQEARDLLSLVLSERLVLFYAQSGAGKSSLINTRLRPGLAQEGYSLLPVARLNGSPPVGIGEVANIFVFNLVAGLDEHGHDPGSLAGLNLSDYFTRRRTESGEAAERQDTPRLLIIDQFEEIFTTNQEHWERRADFFDQLRVAMQADPWLWVLLVLREDYVAAIQPYSRQLPGQLRTRFYMQRLNQEAALAAVTCPAAKEGRPFAPGVAEALVDDLRRIQVAGGGEESHLGEFVEPVQLQVICYRLWENLRDRPEGDITYADVVTAGDVDQGLTDFYETAVARTIEKTGVDERLLRVWLNTHLITPAHTRGLVYRGATETAGISNAVADFLRDAYVLRAEVRGSDTWYELSHDRLVEPIWAANQAWLAEHRSALALAAEFWWSSGRDAKRLLKGIQLKEAEARLRDAPEDLDERERVFINASTEARRQQTRRRLAWVIGIGVCVLLMLAGLSTWAVINRVQAQRERIRAEQARAAAETSEQAAVREQETAENLARQVRVRQLSAEAQVAAEKAPQRNLLLAVEAFTEAAASGKPQDPVAEQALRVALSQTGGVGLSGHGGGISKILISPDSRWLVTQSWAEDDNPRLWDLLSTNVVTSVMVLKGHTGSVSDVAISPDSRWVATAGVDRKVHLWDLKAEDSVAAPIVLAGDSGPFGLLAFSPDGHWLAAAGGQNYGNPSGEKNTTIHLWHLDGTVPPDAPVVLAGHTTAVTAMTFSSDGAWLASAGGYDNAGSGEPDETVRLWDLSGIQTGTSGRVLEGNKAVVNTLAFSADGRWLAAGGMEGTAYLWDVARDDPANPFVLSGHSGAVSSLIFSSDSHWLLTAAGYGRSGKQPDTTPRLWNLTVRDPSSEAISLSGHRELVRDAAFSPDGKTLATASLDTTVRLWDIRGATPITNVTMLIGHDSGIGKLAFSPDGRWLASADGGDESGLGSAGAAVRVWNMEAADPAADPMVLTGHSAPISALAFSPDGRWLMSGSYDGSARIWDFRTERPQPNEPYTLVGNRGQISALAVSPDGRWIAAADAYENKTQSGNNTVHLWQVAEPVSAMVPLTLTQHMAAVVSLTYSADGHWLATGDDDGQVRIWDLTFGDLTTPYVTISGGPSAIRTMTFSVDNRWLITGSADGVARLWDLQGSSLGRLAQMLHHDNAEVTAGIVSPDGHWYASGDGQGVIRLWYLDTAGAATAPMHLKGHIGPITELAFSPDSRWLVSAGGYDEKTKVSDTIARLWKVNIDEPNLEPVLLKGHTGQIRSLAFSPDGHWLVTGGGYSPETQTFDYSARLWNMRSYAPDQRPTTLTGHQGEIYSVAFSADSKRLATGGGDSTTRLWDLSSEDPSSSAVVLTGHGEYVVPRAFVGDDTWLVTAGGDGAIRMWNMRTSELVELACRTAGRNLMNDEWEQFFRGQEYRVTCPELPVHASVIQPILKQGETLAKAGDLEGASRELQRAVRLEPTLETDPTQEARRLAAQGRLEQGRRAMTVGDTTIARTEFSAARELDASVLADVEAEISKLVAQNLVRRGRELAADGDLENATARFRQALAQDPGLTLDPESLARELAADGYLSQGRKAANTGRNGDAVVSFTQAIKLRPQSKDAYAERGQARRNMGQYDEAVADFTQAYELGARSVFVFNQRGIAHYWLAEYSEAISDYSEAIRLMPESGVLHSNLAEALLALGETDEAIREYNTAFESWPGYFWAYLRRASAYMRKGMHELAIQNCNAAIAFDPAHPSGYSCRGDALYDQGHREQALENYRKAVELDPIKELGATASQQLAQYILNHGRERIAWGREDIALIAYRDAVEVDSSLTLKPEREVILEKARVLIRTKKSDAALVLFRDNWRSLADVAATPEALFADTLVGIAKEDAQKRAYDQALTLYQEAARLNPSLNLNPDLEIALARGRALAASGWEDEAAMAAFEQVILIAPNTASTYKDRAAVYQRMGDSDRALADLNRAIELGLRDASTYGARGQIHSIRGEYTKAVADYSQAILLEPKAAFLLWNRAGVYQTLEEWDKANADYTSAIASSPETVGLYYQRGNCFSASGQIDEAIRDFSKAIDLGNSVGAWPTLAERYVRRAQAYVAQGRYVEAIADFSTAIRLNPENGYYRQLRGDAYYDQDDSERAVSDYSEAVKLAGRSGGAGMIAGNVVVVPLNAPARSTVQEAEAEGVARYVFQTAERYASAGQYEKALEVYRRAYGMIPGASFVPEQKVAEARGKALAGEGKVADALAAYREAVTLDPATTQTAEAKLAAALVANAQGQVLAGRYDQALETYRLAAEADPGSGLVPEAEVVRGQGRALVWQGKLEEALSLLEQAASLAPARGLEPRTEIGSILRQQAWVDVRGGQFERALERYRRASEWDSYSAVTPELVVAQSLVSQAESDFATGSEESALNAYRKAAEFAPAAKIVPEAELALRQAIKSVQAEHPDDAMMWLRQAVTLNPALEQDRAADIVWPYFEICQRADTSHQSLDRAGTCGKAASAAATTDSVSLNWAICRWGWAADFATAVRTACSRTDSLAQTIGYGETRQIQMPLAGDMVWRFAAKALQSAQVAVSSMDDISLTAAVYSPSGTMLGYAATGGKSVPATVQLDALPETGTYRVVVSRPSMPVSLPAAGVQRIAVTSPVSPTIAMSSGISTLRPTGFASGEVTNYYLTLASMEEP